MSDFVKDGITYCGVCGAPKQCWVEWFGVRKLAGCLCNCETPEERRQKELEAIRAERIAKAKRRTAFGDSGPHATFQDDDGRQPEIKDVKAYAESFRPSNEYGLVLFGSTGQGKTFAAECLANALLDKGHKVVMRSMPQIVAEVQSAGFNLAEWMEELNDCDLLILDDLGTERMTDFAQSSVFSVVDMRYAAHKPFVVTTNLSEREMSDADTLHKQRLYGRILERCLPVQFMEVLSRLK